jgi:hypothetical protein
MLLLMVSRTVALHARHVGSSAETIQQRIRSRLTALLLVLR